MEWRQDKPQKAECRAWRAPTHRAWVVREVGPVRRAAHVPSPACPEATLAASGHAGEGGIAVWAGPTSLTTETSSAGSFRCLS